MNKRLGLPKDLLVRIDSNKNKVVLYDFDRRISLEQNYQAFLILDIINDVGNANYLLDRVKDKDAADRISNIIDQAKSTNWLIEVDKPSKYHKKTIKTDPGLSLIQWELTNKCNLKCIHCYNESCESNTTQELSTDEIKEIIDQADELGVWQFDLTGGEIFMRSDIIEILEYLHTKHVAVRIATNGTLVDDEIIQKLEKFKIRAYATSIDGGSPETNDFFRGGSGAFKKAYDNLIKIKNSSVPIRRVNVTATTLNEHEMDSIHKMYTSMNIPYVVDNIVPSGRGEIAEKYNVENNKLIQYKLRSFLDKKEDVYGNVLLKNISNHCKDINPSCGVFTNRIFIMANGEYTFCPTLSGREHEVLKLGDSHKISLSQAWKNAQDFIKNKNINCINIDSCKYAAICKGGCRSRAYLNTGRFDGPDAVLCEYMEKLEKTLTQNEKQVTNV
jgi:radical SAM protein with 4Fe4S-binding SPASM domain